MIGARGSGAKEGTTALKAVRWRCATASGAAAQRECGQARRLIEATLEREAIWFRAARMASVPSLEECLRKGQRVNARSASLQERTALIEVARLGRLDALLLLMRHGADVNARAADRSTALHAAAAAYDAIGNFRRSCQPRGQRVNAVRRRHLRRWWRRQFIAAVVTQSRGTQPFALQIEQPIRQHGVDRRRGRSSLEGHQQD